MATASGSASAPRSASIRLIDEVALKLLPAGRADGASDMPVTLLGREIARTDNSGAAHLVLTLEPGEQFDLMLDTSDQRFEDLRPQNPVASFGVGHKDDIFTFDQKFDSEKKAPVYVRGPARPRGPVKIER